MGATGPPGTGGGERIHRREIPLTPRFSTFFMVSGRLMRSFLRLPRVAPRLGLADQDGFAVAVRAVGRAGALGGIMRCSSPQAVQRSRAALPASLASVASSVTRTKLPVTGHW